MMQKTHSILLIFCSCFLQATLAIDTKPIWAVDTVGVTFGESAEDAKSYQLTLRKENTNWVESFGIPLRKYGITSHWDINLFEWRLDSESSYGLSTNLSFTYVRFI